MRIALMLIGSLVATAAQAGPDEVLNKSGCVACHAQDKKLVGPSFKDIAARYRGNKEAGVQLADKVRKGGKGVWGPIPMPPNAADKISDADLKVAVDWVLAQ